MPASVLLQHIKLWVSPSARYFEMLSHILPNTDASVQLLVIPQTPDCEDQADISFWSLLLWGLNIASHYRSFFL